MERASKLISLDDAVDLVEAGTHLSIGGVLAARRPAAFLREVARRKIGNLVLSGSTGGGWDVDLLVALGLVRKAYMSIISLAPVGMAPSVRGAVEAGTMEPSVYDPGTLVAAYLAGSYRHPYHLLRSVAGTDFPASSGLHEMLTDSGGRQHVAVRALNPDLCVLHVEEADVYGNARHQRGTMVDRTIVRASAKTIVITERLIPNDEIRAEPQRTTVPAQWVDHVVEAPFGAHPTATAFYSSDSDHLRAYYDAAEARRLGDSTAFDDYVKRFIANTTTDPATYLAAIGGPSVEARLRESARVG